MLRSVLLPQTYFSTEVSATMAGCFDEVYFLNTLKTADDLLESSLPPEMFKPLEVSDNGENIDLDPYSLQGLMQRWEGFIAGQRGAGNLHTIKAGVKPRPPESEAVKTLALQIISGGQSEFKAPEAPAASPALVLQLAHRMDRKAAELHSMAGDIDNQQERLSEILGQGPEEGKPADFQKPTPGLACPMGPEMEDETLTAIRLKAWASLAPLDKIKGLTPLTLSPQAAVMLLERANTFVGGKPVRSAAGVQSLLWPPVSLSLAGTRLAREALRLRLPHPDETPDFKKALGEMTEAIGQSTLSPELLKSLQDMGGAWLEPGGPQNPGGRMGLMVFPGYNLAGLLELMKGQPSAPEAAGTNCPLWVLW